VEGPAFRPGLSTGGRGEGGHGLLRLPHHPAASGGGDVCTRLPGGSAGKPRPRRDYYQRSPQLSCGVTAVSMLQSIFAFYSLGGIEWPWTKKNVLARSSKPEGKLRSS